MKLNEYDVVSSTRDLSASVPAGSTGTVLIVHESPSLAYIVEFMARGESLDVLTVTPEDIELLTQEDIELLRGKIRQDDGSKHGTGSGEL